MKKEGGREGWRKERRKEGGREGKGKEEGRKRAASRIGCFVSR
jgi:hypothetical protein